MKTAPLAVPRSTRNHEVRLLTSMPAGKMVPLAAIPLLREDAMQAGSFAFSFEMEETAEMLLNAVNVRVMAYLVPNLAFERFRGGMDVLNASYEGRALFEGDAVVPYVETMPFGAHAANPILTYMGKHGRPEQQINTAYIEAYNAIWNFRAKNRSKDIALRTRLQTDLAPAFWMHQNFAHIVPDFDQATMDGNVALAVTNPNIRINGLGIRPAPGGPLNYAVNTVKQTADQLNGYLIGPAGGGVGTAELVVARKATDPISPSIYAEFESEGIQVSLANLDLARKTQAFARLRQQFSGHSDEYIIDLLMDGISIPDQAWKQPIMLADQVTQIGMTKRYATDAANLTASVVNGATVISLRVATPKVPVGGVVMIVAEVVPDQLFERQKDFYLHLTDLDELPQFLRDELDPEKVEIVKNEDIDIDHDFPNDTFGYAPLGWRFNHAVPCIGGKFYRPAVDAGFDEDRQRLWAVEKENPVLSADFYIVSTIHQKPFVNAVADPFECVGRGVARITGLTVFGPALIEASGDYEAVLANAPVERIDKSA